PDRRLRNHTPPDRASPVSCYLEFEIERVIFKYCRPYASAVVFDTLLNGSVRMATVSREVETGTTTLGLVCKDGVVLAADRRATDGALIAHKRTKKVYRLDEGANLAIRAVTAAMKRDAVSGEGIDVALISKDGFKMFDDKEVEKRKASMKLA